LNIIDTVKELSTKYLISSLFGLSLLLLGILYQDLFPIIYPEVIRKLPKEVFLKMTTLAILLVVLSSILSLLFYLKSKVKLIPKCGVLWDKNKEAHCPSCQSPLSEGTFYNAPANMHYFYKCIKCDKKITLKHGGKNIILDEAHKLLNPKELKQ